MSCDFSGVLQPSGLAKEASLKALKLSSLPEYDTRWATAELKTTELLSQIQPNGHSEVQRKAVADYVSGLVRECLNCEVFKFGSVPLKTYLPDGDIDLTAFSSHQELRDRWVLDVQAVLEHEEQRVDAEFSVSEVQCIHAEVKIVKCLVENIVVDISFNQLGGLCTLCFLEEVDRLIQKDHLFKRSILVVKAWCYYESRILGAHHGLISTYALETLVLYIFNVFHATLRGPLEVLFTFLDYFSNFDWEHYCVSLWGPVPLATLPDLTAESPLKHGGMLLLSKEFLESCSALYDVFPKGQDTQTRIFGGKFLNVVDPLRTNNNLGRSVSQANYHRIRGAFTLGARKLAEVFEATEHDLSAGLEVFFSNTWERHQSSQWQDAPPVLPLRHKAPDQGVPDNEQASCELALPKSELLFCEKAFEDKGSSCYLSQVIAYRDTCSTDSTPFEGSSEILDKLGGYTQHNTNDTLSSNTQTLTLSNAKEKAWQEIEVTGTGSLAHHPNGISTHKLEACSSEENPSRVTKDNLEALRRTVSEGGLRKAFDDTELVKRFAEDIQDYNANHFALESMRREAVEDNCGSMKGLQGVERSESRTKGDNHLASENGQREGYWELGEDQSGKSVSNSKAPAGTQDGIASSRSFKEKHLTTHDTLLQMPPKLLFPRSQDQSYEPYNQLFHSPHALGSVSSVSDDSSVNPSSKIKLDEGNFRRTPVNATDAQGAPHVMPMWFPPGPMPVSLPLYGMARPLPLLNSLNTGESLQDRDQKPSFWQKLEQEQLPAFGPVRPWPVADVSINGGLPYSQGMNLELNNIDPVSPNARTRPLAQPTRSSLVLDAVKKSSIRGPAQEGAYCLEPIRAGKTSTGYNLSDAYHGSEGSPPHLPNLTSEVEGDAHLPSNRHGMLAYSTQNLTEHAPLLVLPMDKRAEFLDTQIPVAVHQLVDEPCVPVAVHQPADHVGEFESLKSRTRAINYLTKEGTASNGDASFIPTIYFPMVPMAAAPYHNPSYSQMNLDFQFCTANSWGSCLPYEDISGVYVNGHLKGNLSASYLNSGSKRKITNDALSARVASLSAEEGVVEPSRDLLRSDLANHLRDLDFGRWCQEPAGWPVMEAPSIYHLPYYAQKPFLWGMTPLRPNQERAMAKPFINQLPANVKDQFPMASFCQRFTGLQNSLPGQGVTDITELHNQKTGIRPPVTPTGNGLYRDRKSLSGRYQQVSTQLDQRRHANMAFQREAQDVSYPNAQDSVGSALHGGPFMGPAKFGASGSSKMGQNGAALHLRNHTVPPVLAGQQLEFGSLGPIEVVTSLSEFQMQQDVGPMRSSRSGSSHTSSSSSSSLSDRELKYAMRGKGR